MATSSLGERKRTLQGEARLALPRKFDFFLDKLQLKLQVPSRPPFKASIMGTLDLKKLAKSEAYSYT